MYKKLIRPILFQMDSESAHNVVLKLATLGNNLVLNKLVKGVFSFEHKSLEQNFLNLEIKNPLGLAAGFDKSLIALNFWYALGLGFVECGNITALPSMGNPKPRIFRLVEDQALVNRIGLANIGADAMQERLQKLQLNLPFGINIAKTHDPKILGDDAIKDFLYTFNALYEFGKYVTLNISCPNTTEGKTFEEPKALDALLLEIMKAKSKFAKQNPILVKISPDINFADLENILSVCEQHKINGYVLTNTTKNRDNLKTSTEILSSIGNGGVSGKPIAKRSTEIIRFVYKLLKRPCIMGLGGVDSAESAYEKIKAGASLVQIYTGLIYKGPFLIKQINKGLVELLKKDGFKNISEAVGVECNI